MKWKLPSSERLMVVACVMALAGLALMLWSVFTPTVWPIMIAISVGQGIGTISFVLYLVVVARDVKLARALRRSDESGGATPSDS